MEVHCGFSKAAWDGDSVPIQSLRLVAFRLPATGLNDRER